jgi:hypothetical protein
MTKARNSFAVILPSVANDPQMFYKEQLLNHIRKNFPEFTISGEVPPTVRRGVEYATHGTLLTFGTAKTHDVEWVERPTYACEKGYTPVLDLTKDWDKIIARLNDLCEERYPKNPVLSNGMEVEVHKNFVKLGYNYVSRAEYDRLRGAIVVRKVRTNIVLNNDDIATLYFSMSA